MQKNTQTCKKLAKKSKTKNYEKTFNGRPDRTIHDRINYLCTYSKRSKSNRTHPHDCINSKTLEQMEINRTDSQKLSFLNEIGTGYIKKTNEKYPWTIHVINEEPINRATLRECINAAIKLKSWLVKTKEDNPEDTKRIDFLENLNHSHLEKKHSSKRGCHWPWINANNTKNEHDDIRHAIDELKR